MLKEILIYGLMTQYSAMYFFEQIKEALEDEPDAQLQIRLNSEGGSPDYAMSMIQKIQELGDQVFLKGEAMLHSMALFALCYVDKANIEIYDVSKGILHRAAWDEWIEGQAWFKGSIQEELVIKTNKDLEKAFRARVDVAVLEALPAMKDRNLTLKDIFSMEARHEIILSASDMKKIGLVDSIKRITPTKQTQIKALTENFNKCRSLDDFRIAAASPKPNNDTMTLEEFMAQYPAIYAAIVTKAKADGAVEERSRVNAFFAYASIDAAAVAKAIKEGTPMTMEFMAQMQATSLNKKDIEVMTAEGAASPAAATTAVTKEADQNKKDLFNFENQVRISAGLKPLPEQAAAKQVTLTVK